MDCISSLGRTIYLTDSIYIIQRSISEINFKNIIMDYYNYIKSLHLIFVITWFAGLFYVPRIFIYHIEATKKTATEKEILTTQLKLMAKRLWYIITIKYSSNFMRVWNEGATLILFAVVFLVLLKSTLNMAYGLLGLFGLAALLMLGIKLYKRIRS